MNEQDTSDLGKAIQEVSEKASLLVREEIELAKAEIVQKVSSLARGAAIGAAAGVFILYGLIYFGHFIALGLADLLGVNSWVGYLIVAGVMFIVAGRGSGESRHYSWRMQTRGEASPHAGGDPALQRGQSGRARRRRRAAPGRDHEGDRLARPAPAPPARDHHRRGRHRLRPRRRHRRVHRPPDGPALTALDRLGIGLRR